MKPNKKQKLFCLLVKQQVSFWENTNDITSPTHLSDIKKFVYKNHSYNLEDKFDLNMLEIKLSELYSFISKLK